MSRSSSWALVAYFIAGMSASAIGIGTDSVWTGFGVFGIFVALDTAIGRIGIMLFEALRK